MQIVTKDQELNIGNYYALIIAVNDYEDSRITPLENPLIDGQKLMSVLNQHYGFDNRRITFLENPTRSEIISTFDKLGAVASKDDNVLIFYAGHGYWKGDIEQGYWLPKDASKDNTANWISNGDIRDKIRGLKSKHTLLISDACFGGGIFRTRSVFDESPPSIQEVYKLPSRKAMTSGTLTEVPDKSVFLKYLIKRLEENDKRYLSAEELFVSFKAAVINNSRNVPQFGEIQDAGDEGGDFVFVQMKGERENVSDIKLDETEKSDVKKKEEIKSSPTEEIVIEPELKMPRGFYIFYGVGITNGQRNNKLLKNSNSGTSWTLSSIFLIPAIGYRLDDRFSFEARFLFMPVDFSPTLIEIKYNLTGNNFTPFTKIGLGFFINENPSDKKFPVTSAFLGVDYIFSSYFTAGLDGGVIWFESTEYIYRFWSTNLLICYHF